MTALPKCVVYGQLQTFDFDGLTIDFNSRFIYGVNGGYELPPKKFDLLLLLAKNQGKILAKQQIYENVWRRICL